MKKNKSILENVKKWLEFNRNPNETVLTEPMLLVDDECDFASVNTADEDSDPTKINKAIRDIIGLFDKTAYLAYTATPFANIFINPEFGNDLYPKNFIHVLRSPQNYDGGGYFFANDGDTGILQTDMTDAEEAFPLAHKNYHDVTHLPPSLKRAIKQFYVACSIKDIRRSENKINNKWDSMLIHVSRFVYTQKGLHDKVVTYLEKINEKIQIPNASIYKELEEVFIEDFECLKTVNESWDEVKNKIHEFSDVSSINFPKAYVMNNKEGNNPFVEDSPHKRIIAIGGFKLSRGLTLEGLTISYYYRRSKMYDTLMQMARWYGYHDGFKDILKLWIGSRVIRMVSAHI